MHGLVPTATHVVVRAFGVEQQQRGLSTETIRVRGVVVGAFAESCGGDLFGATKETVNVWLDSLELVARSRTKYLSHLHCFYEFAIRNELTDHDPTARIQRPRLPKLLPRPIGLGDLVAALEAAPPRIEAMLSLACYEGMRCCEIAAFEVEWLWGQGDSAVIIIEGKGGKQRAVPLATETECALHRHGLPRSGVVFPSRFGRAYHPCTVSTLLAGYLRSIGIDATAHQLRHWFGTECWRRSRDLLVTQELMGHADPSTTRGYVALVPQESTTRVVRQLSARKEATG